MLKLISYLSYYYVSSTTYHTGFTKYTFYSEKNRNVVAVWVACCRIKLIWLHCFLQPGICAIIKSQTANEKVHFKAITYERTRRNTRSCLSCGLRLWSRRFDGGIHLGAWAFPELLLLALLPLLLLLLLFTGYVSFWSGALNQEKKTIQLYQFEILCKYHNQFSGQYSIHWITI